MNISPPYTMCMGMQTELFNSVLKSVYQMEYTELKTTENATEKHVIAFFNKQQFEYNNGKEDEKNIQFQHCLE